MFWQTPLCCELHIAQGGHFVPLTILPHWFSGAGLKTGLDVMAQSGQVGEKTSFEGN